MKKTFFAVLFIVILALSIFPQNKGTFEVSYHYSFWSIDLIIPYIEDNFTPDFDYYDPSKGNFNSVSDGNNTGFGIRFFPKGKHGSFSVGLSYERNNFNADIDGQYAETDEHGNRVDAEADGRIELAPHSFNLDFRWELWPTRRIHPYIGFGFGIGRLNGQILLHTKATTHYNGTVVVQESDEVKSLKTALEELEEDGDKYPLNFLPIVHVNLGIRAEIMNNLYLLGEVAIYNGFILRCGASVRF
ncbi:MAG: hypothetical protein GY757_59950 [bacterium]|nr:hypothetical protein [bacterium]